MQASTFAKCMAYLSAAFAKPVPEGVARLWFDVLRDTDDDICASAVRRVAATHKWWPSLSEIVDAVIAVQHGTLQADAAYSQVLRYIRSECERSAVHPLALAVAEDVGWGRIEEEPGSSRRAFVDDYNERRSALSTELLKRATLDAGPYGGAALRPLEPIKTDLTSGQTAAVQAHGP